MKTALYEEHLALGAKMVTFAEWEMPIHYKGVIAEHLAVRQHVGIFDVSHMGRILISGEEAEPFLDYLSTNKIAGKPDLSAVYTVWPDMSGGSVDDVIVYKVDDAHFFVIVNAANREKDLHHLLEQGQVFDVVIKDLYKEEGILAIQGPDAIKVALKIFPEASKITPMHFITTSYKGHAVILSGTGYTGAGGLEIYAPSPCIVELWKRFLKDGKDEKIEPAGLGARDTLRLEMGYALYGHELSDAIAANESVSAWTVKWNKEDFLGKTFMQQLEDNHSKRYQHGIILLDKGIAREGYKVYKNGIPIGDVTSGTHSPTLNKAIAIILVSEALQEGDIVEVEIRQNRAQAEVVSLPFLKIKALSQTTHKDKQQ